DVSARAERLAAGPAHHDDPHRLVGLEPREDPGELVAHRDGHRVHLGLAVDPDRRHRPGPLDPEKLAHEGFTRRTFPLFFRSSTCCTAERASFNGNERSMTGLSRPCSTWSSTVCSSRIEPTLVPRTRRFFEYTCRRSSRPQCVSCEPIVTSLPSRVSARTERSNVSPPMCSMTTSTPRLPDHFFVSSTKSCVR